MRKYGIAFDQLDPHGQAAVQAAERIGARTLVYRGDVAVAAVVPAAELERIEGESFEDGADPLLALCGTCACDAFADLVVGEVGEATRILRR